jgi:hypothetical protein
MEVQTESASRLQGHLEIRKKKKKERKHWEEKKGKKRAKNVKGKKIIHKCPSPAWIQVGKWEICVFPHSNRYMKKKEQWGENKVQKRKIIM